LSDGVRIEHSSILLRTDGFDYFLGGVGHGVGGGEGEIGLGEGLFAGLDVVAFEANDEGEGEVCFLGGFDDAGGDDVAIHDAAEDVDEDSFYVRIAQDDFERGGDLFFARAAADVEEVCGTATVMLDDVHGGHGKAGAVDEAGDVAVELDVIEIEFAGFDLKGRFFGEVAHFLNVFVTVKGVVIETDLGVDRAENFLAVFVHERERVDLDHRGVGFPPGFVNAGDKFGSLVEQVAAEVQAGGDIPRLVRHDADGWIDPDFDDFLRVFFRDLLDIHAAFGAGHDEGTGSGAVEKDSEIIFFFDRVGGTDEHFTDKAAFSTGLLGDEDIAEHVFGGIVRFVGRLNNFDAAFVAGFERAFAAAAGVNLRFNDKHLGTGGDVFVGGGADFVGGGANGAFRNGDAMLPEQLLGLKLVNIHKM
jgi:hypothetical protein